MWIHSIVASVFKWVHHARVKYIYSIHCYCLRIMFAFNNQSKKKGMINASVMPAHFPSTMASSFELYKKIMKFRKWKIMSNIDIQLWYCNAVSLRGDCQTRCILAGPPWLCWKRKHIIIWQLRMDSGSIVAGKHIRKQGDWVINEGPECGFCSTTVCSARITLYWRRMTSHRWRWPSDLLRSTEQSPPTMMKAFPRPLRAQLQQSP